jgi:hypothetical protein
MDTTFSKAVGYCESGSTKNLAAFLKFLPEKTKKSLQSFANQVINS